MTKCEVSKFLEVIKTLYPGLNPKMFITDDCATFWNSYIGAFPENTGTLRLLCAWHAKRSVSERVKNEFGASSSEALLAFC